MDQNHNYVISTIQEVNSLVDDLYEAMMDNEHEDVRKTSAKLKEVIRDIEKSYNEI